MPDKAKNTGRRLNVPNDGYYAIAALLLGLFAYFPSFDAPFVFDSISVIEQNDAIEDLFELDWFWAGGRRWVAYLSFALDFALYRDWVFGFHVTSFAIHAASAGLLYRIVLLTLDVKDKDYKSSRVVSNSRTALVVAAIWFLHPIQTQTVLYTVQRMESLMAFFFLLALLAFIKARQGCGNKWYVLSIGASYLCACTKEIAVALPFVIVLYNFVVAPSPSKPQAKDSSTNLPSENEKRRSHAWAYWFGLFSILLLFASPLQGFTDYLLDNISINSQSEPMAGTSSAEVLGNDVIDVQNLSPVSYAFTQPSVVLHYCRLLLVPVGLTFDYAWPIATGNLTDWVNLFVVILLMSLAVYWCLKRQLKGFCIGSFVLILLPTSSFLPIRDLAVEHRIYLPSACFFALIIGALARQPFFAHHHKISRVIMIAVVLLLTVLTYVRSQTYRTKLSVWADVVAKAPHNPRGHSNLAGALIEERQDYDAGLQHYALALRMIHETADLSPPLVTADFVRKNMSHAANNHGLLLLRAGRFDVAKMRFEQAITANPDNAEAYSNFGNYYFYRRDYLRAIEFFKTAIRIDSNLTAAKKNLQVARQLLRPH